MVTNEEFFNLDNFLVCRKCGRKISINRAKGSYVRRDSTIRSCKACDWISRNGFPNLNDFTKEEITEAIYFFYSYDDPYINDLSLIIDRNLEDCIKLFKELKIANRKCLVKCKCEFCENDLELSINEYVSSEHHYCGYECYWNDKKDRIPHGEDSLYFNRIKTFCTNCGKEIYKIPSNYNKTNKYGDNHNFCSCQCYWNYRTKYYVKEKSVNWHKVYTSEQHDRMSITAITNARKTKTRNTEIQLIVNNILQKYNIRYECEYLVGFMQIDNYLMDYNLMIEVQGDYWHVNPVIYNKTGRLINDTQAKDIIQDKKKRTMMKNKGINILYLWETDIKLNLKLCELLILRYIGTHGELGNYNSFNWLVNDDGELNLRENLIFSFQELPYYETKEIIKPKTP